jgi:hypothetical protein
LVVLHVAPNYIHAEKQLLQQIPDAQIISWEHRSSGLLLVWTRTQSTYVIIDGKVVVVYGYGDIREGFVATMKVVGARFIVT